MKNEGGTKIWGEGFRNEIWDCFICHLQYCRCGTAWKKSYSKKNKRKRCRYCSCSGNYSTTATSVTPSKSSFISLSMPNYHQFTTQSICCIFSILADRWSPNLMIQPHLIQNIILINSSTNGSGFDAKWSGISCWKQIRFSYHFGSWGESNNPVLLSTSLNLSRALLSRHSFIILSHKKFKILNIIKLENN